MKMTSKIQCFFLSLIIAFISFSCSKDEIKINDVIAKTNYPVAARKASKEQFNHEQAGEFAYNHVKYYAATVDPFNYIPENEREAFKNKFNELQAMYEKNHWSLKEASDYLVEQGYYTKKQAKLLNDHHDKLIKFLEKHPDKDSAWSFGLSQEQEIIDDSTLAFKEKSELLTQKAIVRQMLRYKLETMPESAKDNVKGGRIASTQLNCGFWEQLSCWVGSITGLSGLTGLTGNFISSSKVLSKFNVIGAAIGAAVGIFQGFSTCQCQNNGVCQPFTGVSFPFECYYPSNSLQITGWGYGNVTPSQFNWQFYKNGNACNGCNFYTNFTGSDYIYLPGSQISSNSVSTVALMTSNYCDNQWKDSQYFGWYDLSELGKPAFTINGPSTISSADAANYVAFNYDASGAIQIAPNTTILWELIPSGYPGYSATGTILGNNNLTNMQVKWNSTPGFATLKCTATSPCATVVNYYNVHIQ